MSQAAPLMASNGEQYAAFRRGGLWQCPTFIQIQLKLWLELILDLPASLGVPA